MAQFLKKSDFRNLISETHLNQIIQSNPELLDDSMRIAQTEMSGYLRGVFDLAIIFATYNDFDAEAGYDSGITVWYDTTATISGQSVTTSRLYKSKAASAAGVLPTDTTKWEEVEPRHPQIIQMLIDFTLYHLHSVISPSNIPDLRVVRYQDAIKALKAMRKGDITTDLPLIECPAQSRVIISGRNRQSWYF